MVTGSEMGQSCAPATAPDKIAPMLMGRRVTISIPHACAQALTIGMVIGTTTPIVPHEDPVPRAVNVLIKKIMSGKKIILTCGSKSPAR